MDGKKIHEFLFYIDAAVAVGDRICVMLDAHAVADTIRAVSRSGELLWPVESTVGKFSPQGMAAQYVTIRFDGEYLLAWAFIGIRYCIDVETGKLVKYEVTK